MPTMNNLQLSLPQVDSNVTINVTYNANFTAFERHLAALGMVFRERIEVLGVDPAGSTNGTVLTSFSSQNLPVTDGNTTQTIGRNRSMTVNRALLQEDTGLGDADEIRCRVRIESIGFPPSVSPDAFTPERVLLG